VQARSGFVVEQHGFRFANCFRVGSRIDALGLFYGLCGGMCFAALDYYYAGAAVPTDTSAPSPLTRLHRLLLRRQVDSLWPPSVPLRVVDWMRLSDSDLVARTSDQVAQLIGYPEQFVPTPLVLVRADWGQSPTANHQVVVTDVRVASSAVIALSVYDPSYPCQTGRIEYDSHDRALSQSTGERLRGFFVNRYEPQSNGLVRYPVC